MGLSLDEGPWPGGVPASGPDDKHCRLLAQKNLRPVLQPNAQSTNLGKGQQGSH
jgi:hypothetical protein